jgi:peptidyl-prolyl cis-trans isomerase SurA
MQAMLGNGARRLVSGVKTLVSAAALVSLLLAGAGSAMGQVAVPRYQSPLVDAPMPRMNLPLPEPRSSPNAAVVEDVIARVNDQIIDRSDIERAQQLLVDEAQQERMSPADVATREKNLLREMIDTQLLLSRGKELDLNVDADVVRQLDSTRKQHNLDAMEMKDCTTPNCTSLEKAVRDSGITYEDFKAHTRDGIIQQIVVRDEVGRNLRRPSAKEEQAYYDQHKQEFEQPEQVRLSEILIATPADATDAQVAQAQAEADSVTAKLKAGTKFEDLVKQYPASPNPANGGDLGQFKPGALGSKLLEDQTFPLKAGETTAPIRTRQGFVLLKVTEHSSGGIAPLKDVEEQIQEGMYQEQMEPALRKYLTDLREKAYIDIAPGFVDTGASPKETKPVYAAATPLPVAKKSEAKKQRLTPAAAAPGSTGGASPSVAGATTTVPPLPPAGAAAPNSSSADAGSATPAAVAAKPAPGAKAVNVAAHKKPKKIRREKVRFGQAPRNSLPSGPRETLAAGADQGAGAISSVLPATGTGAAAPDTSTNVASNIDLLGPQAPERRKTRYSDRAATEAETKAAAKVVKVKQKAMVTPTPLTAEEKTTQKVQDAALGLNGDTAAKKKKKKDKDAPKERLQDKPPAPPAAKPEATPLPPKSVRDNGEPVVSPPPDLSGVAPAPAAAAPPQ